MMRKNEVLKELSVMYLTAHGKPKHSSAYFSKGLAPGVLKHTANKLISSLKNKKSRNCFLSQNRQKKREIFLPWPYGKVNTVFLTGNLG